MSTPTNRQRLEQMGGIPGGVMGVLVEILNRLDEIEAFNERVSRSLGDRFLEQQKHQVAIDAVLKRLGINEEDLT